MSEFSWSTDPVGFYRQLHPRPVLLTVCGKPKAGGIPHQLGSITDPAAIEPTGVLRDPQYQAVWWTVCGQRPVSGKRIAPHAVRSGWHQLTRKNVDTDSARVDTLSACWVDLDLKAEAHQSGPYRQNGLTAYERFVPAMLARAAECGLPPPTLLLRSGQGLWLLWRLVTEDGGALADDAGPNRQLFRQLQDRLIACFAGFEDEFAKDRKRLMRIPGSVHPEGPTVDWASVTDRAYTLVELDRRVPALPMAAPIKRTRLARPANAVPPVPSGAPVAALPSFDDLDANVFGRVLSSRARHLLDLRSLHVLAADRGGIGVGMRYYALLVALSALGFLYPKRPQVWLPKLSAINLAICRPPQDEHEVTAMVDKDRDETTREAKKAAATLAELDFSPGRGPLSYDDIRALLGVTEDEQVRLQIFASKKPQTPKERKGIIRRETMQLEATLEKWFREGVWGDGVFPTAVAATETLRSRDIATRLGRPFTRERVAQALRSVKRFL